MFPRIDFWGFVKMLSPLSRRSYYCGNFCVLVAVDNDLVRSLSMRHSYILFISQKSLIGFAKISPIISTQQAPSDDFSACRKISIWGAPDFFQYRLGIATRSWARIMRGVNWLKSKFMGKGENVHTRNAAIIPKTVISLNLKMMKISFSEFHWTWDETCSDFSVVALLIFMPINLVILFTKFYILSWEIALFFDCEWTWPFKFYATTVTWQNSFESSTTYSFYNTCAVKSMREERNLSIYEKKILIFQSNIRRV